MLDTETVKIWHSCIFSDRCYHYTVSLVFKHVLYIIIVMILL